MRQFAPFLLLALAAPQIQAQSVISVRSGLINYSEGDVLVNGQPLQRKFGAYTTLQDGSDLVSRAGRAEILLTPNTYLRIGADSAVRMISGSLGDTRVELLGGSAVLDSSAAPGKTPVTLVVHDAAVRFVAQGTFRIDSDPPQLRVFEGEAEVASKGNTVKVRASQLLPLDGATLVRKFTQGSDNLLDLWSDERHSLIANNITDAQNIGDPLVDPDPDYAPLSGYLPLIGPPYGPAINGPAISGGSYSGGTYSTLAYPYGVYPYSPYGLPYSPYGLYPYGIYAGPLLSGTLYRNAIGRPLGITGISTPGLTGLRPGQIGIGSPSGIRPFAPRPIGPAISAPRPIPHAVHR